MLKIFFPTLLLVAALPTQARAQDMLPDIRVPYGDLDLSSPTGIRMLDRRLAAAVKEACPSDNGVHELSLLHVIALCRTEKLGEAAPRREAILAEAAQKRSKLALNH